MHTSWNNETEPGQNYFQKRPTGLKTMRGNPGSSKFSKDKKITRIWESCELGHNNCNLPPSIGSNCYELVLYSSVRTRLVGGHAMQSSWKGNVHWTPMAGRPIHHWRAYKQILTDFTSTLGPATKIGIPGVCRAVTDHRREHRDEDWCSHHGRKCQRRRNYMKDKDVCHLGCQWNNLKINNCRLLNLSKM